MRHIFYARPAMIFFHACDMEIHQSRIGRVGEAFSIPDFIFIETMEVVVLSPAYGIMGGIEGLNNYFSRRLAPSPSAGNLSQYLKIPFCRPKIRDIKG